MLYNVIHDYIPFCFPNFEYLCFILIRVVSHLFCWIQQSQKSSWSQLSNLVFFCTCIGCKIHSFSWQGLDFMGRDLLWFLRVSLCFELLHLFMCLVMLSCLLILTQGVLSLLRARSCQRAQCREEERRGRKLRFAAIFLCQFRNPTACGGKGLSQSRGPQHSELRQPWRASCLQLVLAGTPLPHIFSWHIFPLRSWLPTPFFRNHVLPRAGWE